MILGDKMKKISILSLHLGFGGIEKSVAALANILCQDNEVEIACTYKLLDEAAFDIDSRVKIKYLTEGITPNKKELKEAIKTKNIKNIIREGLFSVKVLRLRKKTMINYIKNCDSDVIIATRDIFDEWLSLYGKAETLKIGWEHNHHHGNMKYALNIIRVNKNLDYLVLVSDSLKKYYEKEMKKYRCKCVMIPNIVEDMPSDVAKLTKKNIVSVGRLSPEKGYLDLITIFSLVRKKHPDWSLNIIGDGPEKEKLSNYIEELGLSDSITLHGFQKKDYIDKILHDSSIYLMTSYTESFGIVLIEAMSHGVPCVAFNSAEGANELINSGENGYLIKNRNHKAFVKKVEDLIEDKKERKRIGLAGLESCKKYSSEVVGKQWLDLIRKK